MFLRIGYFNADKTLNTENYQNLSNSGYNIFITYAINNEIIDVNNYLLYQFDIRPMSLNDVSYTKYPYTYDTSLQELHSHTYVVDFNDYVNDSNCQV